MDQGAIDVLVKLDMTSLTAFNIPLRLLLVVLFSGTLGWERTAKRRGAGIRTYIIVSLGAALTMMTSQFLKDYVADGYTDLSRLGAQVISGIGFIGAGTIMFNGFKQVKGITTAAGLWASACMGLAMGAGFVYGALIVWVLMFLVMTVLDTWENRLRDPAFHRIRVLPVLPCLHAEDEGKRFRHRRFRECPICGKWFLTTDARQTKYCGGLAPGDKLGRTCRQIGNLKGREQRELADDHPIRAIYTRRMNTITQYLHRGTLDEQTAAVMKRLAKDKLERAIFDVAYAKDSYEAEMLQDALLKEAKRKT